MITALATMTTMTTMTKTTTTMTMATTAPTAMTTDSLNSLLRLFHFSYLSMNAYIASLYDAQHLNERMHDEHKGMAKLFKPGKLQLCRYIIH
jgi:hypothetical protein